LSTSDGSVGSTTKIVDHGAGTARWNVVILGDGYRRSELPVYRAQAQNVVSTLRATPPFTQLWGAINVWRVDVISTDSGADDPTACGGTGQVARTYFDATFCGDGIIRRLLTVDVGTALSVARSAVPQSHLGMVLVNSPIYGGSGGAVATVSSHPAAMEVALHEMGHTAFGLADEYEFWAGCAGEKGHDKYVGGEPAQANVTKDGSAATNKWKTLITPGTAMPTTANANCALCDPQPSPVGVGTVGAFEGAGYFHCGLYRGEFSCRMRALNNPYCAVCQLAIRNTIQPFLPHKKPGRNKTLPHKKPGRKKTAGTLRRRTPGR
jgi:IgA peptidase M64